MCFTSLLIVVLCDFYKAKQGVVILLKVCFPCFLSHTMFCFHWCFFFCVVVVTFKYQGISFASHNSCQDHLHLLSPILELSFRWHCLNYLIFFRKMRILGLMCSATALSNLLSWFCRVLPRMINIWLLGIKLLFSFS